MDLEQDDEFRKRKAWDSAVNAVSNQSEEVMKACQAILAFVITVTATNVAFARLQASPIDRKLGTLTLIVDASEDELGAFHVVISKSGTSGTFQKELIT